MTHDDDDDGRRPRRPLITTYNKDNKTTATTTATTTTTTTTITVTIANSVINASTCFGQLSVFFRRYEEEPTFALSLAILAFLKPLVGC